MDCHNIGLQKRSITQENYFCELNQRLLSFFVTEGTKKGTLSHNLHKTYDAKYIGDIQENKARNLVVILDHKDWLFACVEEFFN